jgi:hypothetical protein
MKLCQPYAGPANERAKNVAAGLDAAEKALAIRSDYIDALAYKQLLLRSKAWLEPNRAQELTKEADTIRDSIIAIQEKRKGETAKTQAGAAKTGRRGPPWRQPGRPFVVCGERSASGRLPPTRRRLLLPAPPGASLR